MKNRPKINSVDEMFCHGVYATWHVINQSYKKHLSPLGLTYPQYITLSLLWQQDGRSVGELAANLEMETSTVTPLLKRLEKMGYIKRQRSAHDERRVIISLTKEGEMLGQHAEAITACMINDTGLSIENLETLVGQLKQMRSGLKNRDL